MAKYYLDYKLFFLVCSSQLAMAAKRKYKQEYLNYGFAYLVDKGIVRPQCVIYNDVLSNELFKDNKSTISFLIKIENFFREKNKT